ncbi:MAG: leucine-rich repeat domain-containing protein [Blautia sp.]|nr:leucine-rich repeat domain-containing protein [Blautia sp.]
MEKKQSSMKVFSGSRTLVLLAILVCFLLSAIPVKAESYPTVYISGTVYASNLKNGAEVILNGDTSIVVNTNKTIRCISGRNYSLSITKGSSSNYTLTLAPQEGMLSSTVIDVRTFATNASVTIAPTAYWGTAISTIGYLNLQQGSTLNVEKCNWGVHGNNVFLNGTARINVGIGNSARANTKVECTTGSLILSNKSNSKNKNACIEARSGDVRILGGSVVVGGYRGLYAHSGNILISGGGVFADADEYAIFAGNGKVDISGVVQAYGSCGIRAKTSIIINQQGKVAIAKGTSYGIYSEGSISLYGDVTAEGTGIDGIHAVNGNIVFYNGKTISTGKQNAFYAKYGAIEIKYPFQILNPTGGSNSGHNIVTSGGKAATNVTIGPGKRISGTVSIANKSYKVGSTLTVLSNAPSGTKHYTWDYSSSPSGGTWTPITGAVSVDYKTTTTVSDKYVRANVTIDGYIGTLHTNSVFVASSRAVITQQPAAASTSVGKAFTFSVTATDAKSYYWHVYDENNPYTSSYSWSYPYIPAHAVISGVETSKITLIPKDTWLNGKYIGCSITGKDGTSTISTCAKMTVKPAITLQPAPATTTVGTEFQFRAEATGAIAYKWYIQDASGADPYEWSTVKAHTYVIGEQASIVRLKPTDTWLNNKYIVCEINLGNDIRVYTNYVRMYVRPANTPTPTPTPSAGHIPAAAGTRLQTADGASYQVVSAAVDNPTVTYCAPGATAQGTIKIPATISSTGVTYKVVSVAAGAFKNHKKVTAVVIGKFVKTIYKNAFYQCPNLKKVTLGANVVNIGATAFYQCTSLQEITLPAKVKNIKAGAFRGCKKLSKITVKTLKLTNSTVGSNAFLNTNANAVVYVPGDLLNTYKKLLIARGISSNATFIKF